MLLRRDFLAMVVLMYEKNEGNTDMPTVLGADGQIERARDAGTTSRT